MAELLKDNLEAQQQAINQGETKGTQWKRHKVSLTWVQCFGTYTAVEHCGDQLTKRIRSLIALADY